MTEYQYELLDRYFLREMSPEEAISFRSDLESDAELRQAFNLRRLSAAALHRSDVQAFKEKTLAALQPQVAAPAPMLAIRRLSPYRWALAASVALLLAALAWWLLGKPSDRSQQLYAQYDVPELYPKTGYALVNEGLFHKGVIGSQEFLALKIKGLQAFDSKDWDAAIRLLSEYLTLAKPDDEETPDEINLMNLYVGRAWLEKGDAPKAIAALQKADAGVVDKVNYGYLQEIMRWHLALAHLKNKDPEAAKRTAELLQNAAHPTVNEQANKLLNDLK